MKKRRNQYRECPYCHDLLDPGEHCDCREREEKEKETKLIIAIDAYMARSQKLA